MSQRCSSIQRLAGPTAEPITVAEAKAQLRVLHGDDDAYIEALVGASREWAESFTRRAFVEQTWVAQYAEWPTDRTLELGRFPIRSVESVSFRDSTGAWEVLDAADYTVDEIEGSVRLKSGVAVPSLSYDFAAPFKVEFTAGYVTTANAANLPKNLKQALLLTISNFYANRVPVVQGTITSKVPLSVESLLRPLKLYTV